MCGLSCTGVVCFVLVRLAPQRFILKMLNRQRMRMKLILTVVKEILFFKVCTRFRRGQGGERGQVGIAK